MTDDESRRLEPSYWGLMALALDNDEMDWKVAASESAIAADGESEECRKARRRAAVASFAACYRDQKVMESPEFQAMDIDKAIQILLEDGTDWGNGSAARTRAIKYIKSKVNE